MSACDHREIFISYGREPEVIEFVKKLKHGLEENQFTVWLDLVDIPSGSDWHGAIGTALHNCRALIAVITNKYINSRYCSSELYTADGDRKRIYPVILEEVDFGASETARGVKYVISGINWTMFRANVDDHAASLAKLVQGLRAPGTDSTKSTTVHVPTEQLGNLQLSPQPISNSPQLLSTPKTPSAPQYQSFSSPTSQQVYPGHAPQSSPGHAPHSSPPSYQSSAAAPVTCGPQTQPVPAASLGFPCGVGFQSPGSGYHATMYPPSQAYTHPLGNYPSMGTYPPPGSGTYPPTGSGTYPPPGSGTYPPPGSGTYPPPGSGTYPPPGSGTYPPPGSGTYPPTGSGTYPIPGSGTYPPPGSGTYPPPGSGTYPPAGSGTYPPPGSDTYLPPGSGTYPPPGSGTYPHLMYPPFGSGTNPPDFGTHLSTYPHGTGFYPPPAVTYQPSGICLLPGTGTYPPPPSGTGTYPPPPSGTGTYPLSPSGTFPSPDTCPPAGHSYPPGSYPQSPLPISHYTGSGYPVSYNGQPPSYSPLKGEGFAPPTITSPLPGAQRTSSGLPLTSPDCYQLSPAMTTPPCPTSSVSFKVGTRVEAVDKRFPYFLCVATIMGKKDNSIKIHFDGWGPEFDYECAPDSIFIHPVGWCEKHGWELQKPNGLPWSSWKQYLEDQHAAAADESLFSEKQLASPGCLHFERGMKLEAKDRLNPHVVAVATIADIQDDQLLIHFDGWSDRFDYWANPSCTDIHPPMWCGKNGTSVMPPNDYNGSFKWNEFLARPDVWPAPAYLFTEDQRAGPKVEGESSEQPSTLTSDLKGFQVGMKLEAKDRANPQLICVATVADISDGRLLIHFDGWANNFDYWCGPESPDLHPVGWCNRMGVPLQPPQDTVGDFSWDSYLQSSGSIAAPESCFIS